MADGGDDQECPVCRGQVYLNPGMRILVSPCCHRACTSCVGRLPLHAARCPTCAMELKRTDFVDPLFELVDVEREVRIRNLIMKQPKYNLKPEHFASLREYNDYLEEIEEKIFDYISKIDEESKIARREANSQEAQEKRRRRDPNLPDNTFDAIKRAQIEAPSLAANAKATAIAADADSGERGEADETDEWLRNYDPMATCYYDRYVPKHPEFYHDVGEGASAAALAGGYPAHMRHLMALDSAFTSLFERPIHWAAVGSDR